MGCVTIKEVTVGNLAAEMLDYGDLAGDMPRYSICYLVERRYNVQHCETIEEAEKFWQKLLDNQAA